MFEHRFDFDLHFYHLLSLRSDQHVEDNEDMIRIYSKPDLVEFFKDPMLLASDEIDIPSQIWYKHLLIEDDSVSVVYTKTKNLTVIND